MVAGRLTSALVLLLMLAACAPPPTPLPVDFGDSLPAVAPAQANSAAATEAPPGVAVGPWAGPFAPLARMRGGSPGTAVLDTLPDDPSAYALVVDYGVVPVWELAPSAHTVALALNVSVPPLDDPAVRQPVAEALALLGAPTGVPGQQALRPAPAEDATVIARRVREALANAGHPDGVVLRVRLGAPGVLLPPPALEGANITLSVATGVGPLAPEDGASAHVALFTWATDADRAAWTAVYGPQHVADVARLPISMWLAPGRRIVFTPDGWPTLAGP